MARVNIDRTNEAQYGVPTADADRDAFYARLAPGAAVQGRTGSTWQHTGSGWAIDDAAGGSVPPATNQTPGIVPPVPGEGPTTPPGTPQRPSALPPSPPPTTPAPQIPLGPTTGVQDTPAAAVPPGSPDVMTQGGPHTGPGLIDASRQGTDAQVDTAFRTRLLELLQQDPNAVSLTDADIAPESRAFRGAAERGALRSRAELMERASAEGIADSEATRAAGRAASERADQAIGANDAALIGRTLQTRRDTMQKALDLANARGMQQEANNLQRQIANLDAQIKTRGLDLTQSAQTLERDLASLDSRDKQYLSDLDAQLRREGYGTQERLAQLDAEIRKLGITTQGSLGQLELSLRDKLGTGELNLGFLQTLLQDRQVGNAQGIDVGKWASLLNKESLLTALGGGA